MIVMEGRGCGGDAGGEGVQVVTMEGRAGVWW